MRYFVNINIKVVFLIPEEIVFVEEKQHLVIITYNFRPYSLGLKEFVFETSEEEYLTYILTNDDYKVKTINDIMENR